MRILVTGGAGFIGSHLVEALVSRGYNVRVVDDLSTGRESNLEAVRDKIEFFKGDIRDPAVMIDAVKGVDVVYHLAAKINVEESYAKPDLYWEVNVLGTRLIVESMVRMGVKRLIFMSSAAVYGDPVYIPIDENHPVNPLNPYGETKLEGEEIIRRSIKRGEIQAVIVRLFNAYGPRQEGNPYAGVVQKFIERVSSGKPPIIFGDGLQSRDFIYVKDVVSGLLYILERVEDSMILNLGTGVETRIIDLARLILDLLGRSDLDPVFSDPRPGDVRRSVADIRRLREMGWSPQYSLRDGLTDMLGSQVGE